MLYVYLSYDRPTFCETFFATTCYEFWYSKVFDNTVNWAISYYRFYIGKGWQQDEHAMHNAHVSTYYLNVLRHEVHFLQTQHG